MDESITRRAMLNRSVVSCLGASYFLASPEERALAAAIEGGRAAAPPPPLPVAGTLPTGRIGDLQLSRLILGGNLIGGFAHSRDLLYVSSLFKAYNTRDKIMETFRLAEAHGINAVFLSYKDLHYAHTYNREYGGKLQSICQVVPSAADPEADIRAAFEEGASTMYIQGNLGDRLVRGEKFDFIAKVLDTIRACGCPAGMGAHALDVIRQCEARGLAIDYYVKTFHPDSYWSAHPAANRNEYEVDSRRYDEHDQFHDNIFDLFPNQTAEFMRTVSKPWIAFKVMAAGALRPQEGFQFAFEGGADFVCAGMFDFQVAEDADAARAVLTSPLTRQREWRS